MCVCVCVCCQKLSTISALRPCDSSSVYQSLSLSIHVIKSLNLFLKVFTQTWALGLNFTSISFFLSPGQASGVLSLSNVWNKTAALDAGEV